MMLSFHIESLMNFHTILKKKVLVTLKLESFSWLDFWHTMFQYISSVSTSLSQFSLPILLDPISLPFYKRYFKKIYGSALWFTVLLLIGFYTQCFSSFHCHLLLAQSLPFIKSTPNQSVIFPTKDLIYFVSLFVGHLFFFYYVSFYPEYVRDNLYQSIPMTNFTQHDILQIHEAENGPILSFFSNE